MGKGLPEPPVVVGLALKRLNAIAAPGQSRCENNVWRAGATLLYTLSEEKFESGHVDKLVATEYEKVGKRR